ncbi:MAG TPA: anti-sigma factor antagonist [Bacillota bacterium]
MNIEINRSGSVLIARIQGELDLSTAPLFREKVEAELEQFEGVKHLLLDLEETPFIDSSGLGVILGRFKHISQRGGRLSAINVSDHVRRIFELSGLLKIMSIQPTLEDALNSLKER